MKKTHNWDKEAGAAYCIIEYNGQKFEGYASCHPDDLPFLSPLTGGYIAECRADIKYYQHIKNNELYPQIKALKHLLDIIKQNKNYNANSMEAKKLYKEIKIKEKELEGIKENIKEIKQQLSSYLEAKEKLHTKIRTRELEKDSVGDLDK
jgi:hypothetical protein